MPQHPRHHRGKARTAGQSLVEFALVFPILMLMIGGIIQFGLIFWAQSTLTQVVSDTGRWAATQQDCTNSAPVVSTANAIASRATLFGYSPGSWTASNVRVTWQIAAGAACPPGDNTSASFVTIETTHAIPTFFSWIPGSGPLTASAQFRMEPAP